MSVHYSCDICKVHGVTVHSPSGVTQPEGWKEAWDAEKKTRWHICSDRCYAALKGDKEGEKDKG